MGSKRTSTLPPTRTLDRSRASQTRAGRSPRKNCLTGLDAQVEPAADNGPGRAFVHYSSTWPGRRPRSAATRTLGFLGFPFRLGHRTEPVAPSFANSRRTVAGARRTAASHLGGRCVCMPGDARHPDHQDDAEAIAAVTRPMLPAFTASGDCRSCSTSGVGFFPLTALSLLLGQDLRSAPK